jgi:hypothetical protein
MSIEMDVLKKVSAHRLQKLMKRMTTREAVKKEEPGKIRVRIVPYSVSRAEKKKPKSSQMEKREDLTYEKIRAIQDRVYKKIFSDFLQSKRSYKKRSHSDIQQPHRPYKVQSDVFVSKRPYKKMKASSEIIRDPKRVHKIAPSDILKPYKKAHIIQSEQPKRAYKKMQSDNLLSVPKRTYKKNQQPIIGYDVVEGPIKHAMKIQKPVGCQRNNKVDDKEPPRIEAKHCPGK